MDQIDVLTRFCPGCFTKRQRDVMAVILDDPATKVIASRLHMSVQSVKHHLAGIYDRLGIKRRYELIQLLAHDNADVIHAVNPARPAHRPKGIC